MTLTVLKTAGAASSSRFHLSSAPRQVSPVAALSLRRWRGLGSGPRGLSTHPGGRATACLTSLPGKAALAPELGRERDGREKRPRGRPPARPPPSDCAQLCGPARWPHVVLGDRRPAGPRRPRPAALWGRGATVTFPPRLVEEQPPASALWALCARGFAGGGRQRPCIPVPPDARGRRPTPGCPLHSVCPLPSAPLPARCPARSPAHPSLKSRCYLAQRTDGRTDGWTAGRAARAAGACAAGRCSPAAAASRRRDAGLPALGAKYDPATRPSVPSVLQRLVLLLSHSVPGAQAVPWHRHSGWH
nr:uncharacterized protein LOC112920912 [Vulpes vulpes]